MTAITIGGDPRHTAFIGEAAQRFKIWEWQVSQLIANAIGIPANNRSESRAMFLIPGTNITLLSIRK